MDRRTAELAGRIARTLHPPCLSDQDRVLAAPYLTLPSADPASPGSLQSSPACIAMLRALQAVRLSRSR